MIVASFITGCSSTPVHTFKDRDESYKSYIETENLLSQDKIRTFKFSGWQALSNQYLIITSSPRNKYLVEVNSYCSSLYHAQSIALHQGMSSSLSTRFDSISVPKSKGNKCFIKSIYKVTKAQVKDISALKNSDKSRED
jgi:hypothetical protein